MKNNLLRERRVKDVLCGRRKQVRELAQERKKLIEQIERQANAILRVIHGEKKQGFFKIS